MTSSTLKLAIIIMGLALTYSCKKCMTCTATQYGTITTESKCGMGKKLDKFQSDFKDAHTRTGTSIVCVYDN